MWLYTATATRATAIWYYCIASHTSFTPYAYFLRSRPQFRPLRELVLAFLLLGEEQTPPVNTLVGALIAALSQLQYSKQVIIRLFFGSIVVFFNGQSERCR